MKIYVLLLALLSLPCAASQKNAPKKAAIVDNAEASIKAREQREIDADVRERRIVRYDLYTKKDLLIEIIKELKEVNLLLSDLVDNQS